LHLTELNVLMYAPATVIAGYVKEKTTPKNARSEPAGSVHEKIECYSKELAILNELKKGVPHTPGLPEG